MPAVWTAHGHQRVDPVGTETGIGLAMEPFQMTPGGQIPGAAMLDTAKQVVLLAATLGGVQ